MGSSLNSSNAMAFSRADLSISVDPMLSPWCETMDANRRMPFVASGTGGSFAKTKKTSTVTAVEISACFNALPCALSMRRDDNVR